MKAIGAIVLLVGGLMVDAIFAWWCGRVLLPAMGLTAPDYWTWFWGLVPGLMFIILSVTISAVIKTQA